MILRQIRALIGKISIHPRKFNSEFTWKMMGMEDIKAFPFGFRQIFRSLMLNFQWYTLPETNIAPEIWWLEDYFPFRIAYFQVLC